MIPRWCQAHPELHGELRPGAHAAQPSCQGPPKERGRTLEACLGGPGLGGAVRATSNCMEQVQGTPAAHGVADANGELDAWCSRPASPAVRGQELLASAGCFFKGCGTSAAGYASRA